MAMQRGRAAGLPDARRLAVMEGAVAAPAAAATAAAAAAEVEMREVLLLSEGLMIYPRRTW